MFVFVCIILSSYYIAYRYYKNGVIDYVNLVILLFLIALHHLTALIIPPAPDMYSFNQMAASHVGISTFSFSNSYNISIVYGLFYLFQKDILIGHSLGIIGYTFAMIYLFKFMNLMNLPVYKKSWTLILTSLSPAALYYDSSILREPWMLCFFIMFMYFLLKHYFSDRKKYILFAYLSLFFLLSLHFKSAAFYSLFISILYFIFYYRKFYRFSKFLSIIVVVFAMFFIIFIFSYILVKNFGATGHSFNEFIIKKLQFSVSYQSRVQTNTNYTSLSDININPFLLILKQIIRYCFAPYPWQMLSNGFVSLVLGGIAFVRFVMFIGIVKSIRDYYRFDKENRIFIIMLCVALFFITFIFALGTSNYGTSNRHWDISWWILCLLFIYTRKKILVFKI